MINIDTRAFNRDAYELGRAIRRAVIGARKRAYLASLEAQSVDRSNFDDDCRPRLAREGR